MASRLKTLYTEQYKKELMKDLGLTNPMSAPEIKKIVINSGVGEAVTNKSAIDEVVEILTLISGQKPVVNKSTKAI